MHIYSTLFQSFAFALVILFSVAQGAVIRQSEREPRTLGLLTAGAGALQAGIGAAGSAVGTAIGVAAAAKPLILLGLGKCKCLKMGKCVTLVILNPFHVYAHLEKQSGNLGSPCRYKNLKNHPQIA